MKYKLTYIYFLLFNSRKLKRKTWENECQKLYEFFEKFYKQIFNSMDKYNQEFCDKLKHFQKTTLEMEFDKAIGKYFFLFL